MMARSTSNGIPLIFQGDTSNHGGMVISGHDAWTAKGANGSNIPVARVTDMFSCPIHGVNPIIYSPESGINIRGASTSGGNWPLFRDQEPLAARFFWRNPACLLKMHQSKNLS